MRTKQVYGILRGENVLAEVAVDDDFGARICRVFYAEPDHDGRHREVPYWERAKSRDLAALEDMATHDVQGAY